MKRILFLLLLTVSVYGQNPSRFAKIQITGNTNSGTATKVNVQEANGEVNTQTINTGFNKNIGLGGSDVVGANTLLNQYSTTPIDWTATAFNSGQVVFYVGKQWLAKMATVAGDVPSVSSKWEEITFEALANKTTTVDQTIIDGSTNAVSSNAVFDALATKAPISSVHNPVTLGTPNGLSLSTQQLSLGLASSSTTGALSGTDWNTFNGKFNTPTGLTTNYLPKWNGSGFGNSSIFDDGTNIGIGTTNPTANLTVKGAYSVGSSIPTDWALLSVGRMGVAKNNKSLYFDIFNGYAEVSTYDWNLGQAYSMIFQANGGNSMFGTNVDNGSKVQVAGTISASPATTANQVVVKSQLDAKFNTPTGLTTNYLPKWTGSGFGDSSIFDNGTNVGIGTTTPNHLFTVEGNSTNTVIGLYDRHNAAGNRNWALASNQYAYGDFHIKQSNALFGNPITAGTSRFVIATDGNVLIGTTSNNEVDRVQVAGTISASPATTANQVVVKSQLDAAASSGRYTPTVNVITGATSVSVQSHTYIKIGNIVTVYGESKPTPIVSGVTVIYEISLPIARANTTTKALGFGSMNVAGGSTNQFVRLESSSATTVRISFNVSASGTPSVLYSLQYDITQ